MPPKRNNAPRQNALLIAKFRRSARGFTVTELMLAVAIMGVIIFALYSVFNQTQRAMRSTETQGDVAERARAILDIITREIEQAHPTFSAIRNTNNVLIQEVNMMGGYEFAPQYSPRMQKTDRTDVQPRTNFFHNIFFYTHHTNAWQAIGYRVVYVTNGVGVLERFETNQFGLDRPVNNQLANAFIAEPLTNATYHHIADGVIHLVFIPYDSNGRRLGFDTTNRSPDQYKILRGQASGSAIGQHSDVSLTNLANVLLYEGYPNARAETLPYASRFSFRSNAIPSYIEMEFALLEPDTLSQYYLMQKDQNPNAANFLQKQMAKVHLFRQRIPIRTAVQ
jgi:prepilin-type N-terminal cleavage/methylation domain-containing protein